MDVFIEFVLISAAFCVSYETFFVRLWVCFKQGQCNGETSNNIQSRYVGNKKLLSKSQEIYRMLRKYCIAIDGT